MKYFVRGPDRSTEGHEFYSRGGRRWPNRETVTVELVDQEECPLVPNPEVPGGKIIDPVRIGRRNWSLIEADDRLSKNIAPDDAPLTAPMVHPLEAVQMENQQLRRDLASLSDRLAALERELGVGPKADEESTEPAPAPSKKGSRR